MAEERQGYDGKEVVVEAFGERARLSPTANQRALGIPALKRIVVSITGIFRGRRKRGREQDEKKENNEGVPAFSADRCGACAHRPHHFRSRSHIVK